MTQIEGQRIINNKWQKKHLYRTGVEGLVIEVAAVCKGNSEKVCTGDFGQEIERIKLLQRKFYFLKEASMFWDYHFFQRSVPPPSRFSLISNVWWPACLPSLQAQISSKSLSFKRRHSWEVVHLTVEVFSLVWIPHLSSSSLQYSSTISTSKAHPSLWQRLMASRNWNCQQSDWATFDKRWVISAICLKLSLLLVLMLLSFSVISIFNFCPFRLSNELDHVFKPTSIWLIL